MSDALKALVRLGIPMTPEEQGVAELQDLIWRARAEREVLHDNCEASVAHDRMIDRATVELDRAMAVLKADLGRR